MSYRFLEAEDWNALIARVETIEGMGGAPHTFDSHTDVDAYSEALGDIPRWDGDSWSALGIGSTNDILTVTGGLPVWDSDITLTSLIVPVVSYPGTLKLQDLGAGDVSLFEDQTTTTDRYLYLYGGNTSNYLRLIHTGVYAQLYTNSGAFYIDTQGSLSVRSQQTDTDMTIRIIPEGTGDTTSIDFRNSESTANHGMCLFRLAGGVASIAANTVGSGTEVNKFMISRVGRMDISFFEDQTTTTQRYLTIYRPNTSEYLQLGHNGYGNIYSSTGIVNIANDDLILGNPATSNFRIRESSNTWYVGPDAGDVQLNSGNGNIHLNSFGTGDVDLFLNQTTATQRALNIHAPNSPYYGYIYHNTYDVKIGNSYDGRRIDFECDVYVEGSASLRDGGLLRIYNADNTSYINIQCQAGTDSGVGLISCDDGGLDINPNGPIMMQMWGRGNVSLFEEQTTATQRAFQVFAPNSTKYIQMYHDDVNGYINTQEGGIVVLSSAALSLNTGANEWIYFSAGGTFRWQDADAGNAMRMTLDSSTGLLTLLNGTGITEFSIDDTLAGDSDDAVPTEKAVKAYVTSQVSGGGTSTLQRHVVMDMQPYDGATWDFENGTAILIDADSQKIHAVGMIPDGATRFKVLVWSEHVTSSDTTYMQFLIQGKEIGETSPSSYYNDTSEWASTSANEQMIEDSGWQTLDAGDERIYVELERITAGGTDDLYVQTLVLVFELDVGNTIGSQAKTELLVPCQIEPYDGAEWSTANGKSIFMNTADELVLATGYIPPNTERIEVIIFAQHPSGSGSTSVTTTIKGQECGTTSTESYATDTSAWTSTLANEQICKTFGWYTTDADQERFFIEIKWNSGTDLHINEVVLNCFTPIVVAGTISQPSDSTPADMPDSATAGVSDDVSRADHVHPLSGVVATNAEVAGGAAWTAWYGLGADLDANGKAIFGTGHLPLNAVRFRLRVFYWNTDAGGTTCTTSIGSYNCSTASMTFNHLSSGAESFPTASGGIECWISNWYTNVAGPAMVGFHIQRSAGQRIIVYPPQIEWDSESS